MVTRFPLVVVLLCPIADSASVDASRCVLLGGCMGGFADPDPDRPAPPSSPRLASACQATLGLSWSDCFWCLFPARTHSKTRPCQTRPPRRQPGKKQRQVRCEASSGIFSSFSFSLCVDVNGSWFSSCRRTRRPVLKKKPGRQAQSRQARVTDSSSKTKSAFHRHVRRNAFRRDARQQSRFDQDCGQAKSKSK